MFWKRRKTAPRRRSGARSPKKRCTIYLFDDVLGPKFNARNLPVTDAFFERMQGDARAILVARQERYAAAAAGCGP